MPFGNEDKAQIKNLYQFKEYATHVLNRTWQLWMNW